MNHTHRILCDQARYAPVAVVILAVVLRAISFLTDDVSWLITLAEKTWHGGQPYIDFFEPNLPAAFLIYLPAALVGSWTGIGAEPVVNVLTILAGCAAVWYSGRLLVRHGLIERAASQLLAALALAVLLVLPGNTFAEREHIALIALLPLLSVYVVRTTGAEPPLSAAVVAGAGAALAIAIKPFFALSAVLPFAYLLYLQRAAVLRLVFAPENLVIGALVFLYVLAIIRFFPAFIDRAIPVDLAVYGPSRMSALRVARNESTLAMLGAAAAMLLAARGRIRKPLLAILGLAACGFAAAYFYQAKCFPYHAYPTIALCMLAAGIALLGGPHPGSRRRVTIAVAAMCVVAAVALHDFGLPLAYPKLFHAARAVAPPHPKVVAIAGPLIGPQITRYLDGQWVSRANSQGITRRAEDLLARPDLTPERRREIEFFVHQDMEMLKESLRTEQPDLIVADAVGIKWALAQPALASELRNYTEAADGGEYMLWVRRKAAPKE